jgi:hypothetical protein
VGARRKREAVAEAGRVFGIDPAPLTTLLDLREGLVKPRSIDPAALYGQYMLQIRTVVDHVDRLEK